MAAQAWKNVGKSYSAGKVNFAETSYMVEKYR
jgi:hypothetical protein